MLKFRGPGLKAWVLPALVFAVAHAAEPPGMPAGFMEIAMRQLPLEGAPLAVAGLYMVVTEAAFGTSRVEVRRPADLGAFPSRDKLPVVVWGNGGCAINAGDAGGFLSTLASHGFLVLTTAGPAGSAQATAQDLKATLDWAFAENARAGAALRDRIDVEHVAMMGTSCGGYIALANAADPRIDTMGIWNSGAGDPGVIQPVRPAMPPMAILKSLHGPALYIDGGEVDHLHAIVEANFAAIDHVPVFYGSRNNGGHSGTFRHPGGGEFANIAAHWLKWQLKGDAMAGRTFAGAGCGLCTDSNWVVKRKRL